MGEIGDVGGDGEAENRVMNLVGMMKQREK